MFSGNISDKLLNKYGFANSCTAKKTDFTALCVRGKEVDYLNACFKYFNAWGDSSRAADIDYIFFSGFKSCIYFKTIDSSYLGRKYISDHYPVCACLSMQ